MHIEFLTEDESGGELLKILIPKILGHLGQPHTWKVTPHHGLGEIPKQLSKTSDAKKTTLLNNLPKLLKAYSRTGYDAAVVVMDLDNRNQDEFRDELDAFLQNLNGMHPGILKTIFCFSVEEIEAWYFGDHKALTTAYPKARKAINGYEQDSICGTWERLEKVLSNKAKCDWAKTIGPHMNIDANKSPSFQKFLQQIRELVGVNSHS